MSDDTQTLDIPVVTEYLTANLSGFEGPLEVSKFQTGQSNPTFREFRVQKALEGSKVPVAKMHLLCEDDDVIGSAFYVMDHVAGRNFHDPTDGDLTPEARGAVIDDMNRVLAEMHMVDIDAVGLGDYGPPGNYFERQVGRWSKQYRASETAKIDAMDTLMDRLAAEMPADDGQRTLVHQLPCGAGLGTQHHWASFCGPRLGYHAVATSRWLRRARAGGGGSQGAWPAFRCRVHCQVL